MGACSWGRVTFLMVRRLCLPGNRGGSGELPPVSFWFAVGSEFPPHECRRRGEPRLRRLCDPATVAAEGLTAGPANHVRSQGPSSSADKEDMSLQPTRADGKLRPVRRRLVMSALRRRCAPPPARSSSLPPPSPRAYTDVPKGVLGSRRHRLGHQPGLGRRQGARRLPGSLFKPGPGRHPRAARPGAGRDRRTAEPDRSPGGAARRAHRPTRTTATSRSPCTCSCWRRRRRAFRPPAAHAVVAGRRRRRAPAAGAQPRRRLDHAERAATRRKWEPNPDWKTGAPAYLPTEIAARALGLRFNHPARATPSKSRRARRSIAPRWPRSSIRARTSRRGASPVSASTTTWCCRP